MSRMCTGLLIAGLCAAGESPVLLGQEVVIRHVAYAPDGRSIAVAMPGRVEIWDTELKGPIQSFAIDPPLAGMPRENRRLAWAPDSRKLAVCSPQYLYVWDGGMGKPPKRIRYGTPGPMQPTALAWDPKGERLALATFEGVMILNPERVPDNLPLPFDFAVRHQGFGSRFIEVRDAGNLGWSPDGGLLAGVGSNAIRLWDPATGLLVREMALPAGGVAGLRQKLPPIMAWSPAEPLLATCDSANEVEIWDATTGEPRLKIDGGLTGHIRLGWSRKGDRLGLITEDSVTLFDAVSGARISRTRNAIPVDYAAFSPDLDRAVLADFRGVMQQWPPLQVGGAGSPQYLGWAWNGDLVLWGDGSGVQIWDVSKRQPVADFAASVWGGRSVALGRNSGGIMLADPDGKLLSLFPFRPGVYSVARTLTGAAMPIYAVGVAPEGRMVAALGGDSLWTWNISERDPKGPQRFPVPGTDMVWASARTVLVAGLDGSVTEFDVGAGKRVWRFLAPIKPGSWKPAVAPASLAPDGQSFVAGGALWRRAAGGAPPERVDSAYGDGYIWTADGASLFSHPGAGGINLRSASTGNRIGGWGLSGTLADAVRWVSTEDGHRVAALDANGAVFFLRFAGEFAK